MKTTILVLSLAGLLSGCAEYADMGPGDLVMDSEACRSRVAEEMSRARDSLRMASDVEARLYDERYRSCMAGAGYGQGN